MINKTIKRMAKRTGALFLAGSILAALPGYAATTVEKEENIYASLNGDGTVDAIYVINEYTLQTDQTLTDYGEYASVKNITSDGEIKLDGDKVELQGKKGKYYYQGNLKTKELPWNISITYYLDGKELQASELGGKSGHLEIVLTSTKNTVVDEAFFENYLLQGKIILDSTCCRNITAQGATIASIGSDKQLLYNIMPGKEKEYRIRTEVTDFEMDGISFSAVPVGFDVDKSLIDTNEMDEKISDFKDAVSELDDGAWELSDGVRELKDGAYDLHDGSIDLFDGAVDLQDGAAELDDGVRKLVDGAQTLCDGSGSLEKGMYTINDGLQQLNEKSQSLRAGSSQLKAGTDSLAAGLSVSVREEEIAGMVEPAIKSGVASALQAAGVSDQGVIEAIAAQTAQSLASGIGQGVSGEINTKMQPLASGITSLQSGATALDAGIAEYTAAVTAVKNGSQSACDGMGQLRYGINELKNGTVDLKEGTEKLLDGTNDLVDGSVDLYDGTKELYEGTNDLAEGTETLTDGTDTFKTETGDLDGKVDDKIDEAISKVSGSDFVPVSFVSARNQSVAAVQFAMTTEAITCPETESVVATEENKSFWKKLLELFVKD